jgi:spore maturation protein CgeB
LVDIQYDYGDPSRGLNLIGQYGFKQAIESLGHQVIPFYYDDDLAGSSDLQTRLLEAADREKPELIVFCLFRDQFKPETLRVLSAKYRTLNWFGDDTWRFDSFSSQYGPCFTYAVTTDKFSVSRYHEIGVKNVILSQWAAIDTQGESEWTGQYDYDVTFIGQHHPYREWFTSQLRRRGIRIECFGRGWANGPLSGPDMNRLFARSKISLNLGNSTSYDVRYLLSHPKALAYAVRSKKDRSQIKARNFEIPFFGGFQVTEYVPSIEDYLIPGHEVVCYRDLEEAELVIRYYLNHETERETLRRRSHQRAISEHGYSHRWEQIFKALV